MRVTTKICMTKDVGLQGNLFGGNMLAWMDEAAAIYAHQATGERQMVTFRFAEIRFTRPVREGSIVEFHCEGLRRGVSSATFDVLARVGAEEVFRTSCTFVAVDASGRKKPIDWGQAPDLEGNGP